MWDGRILLPREISTDVIKHGGVKSQKKGAVPDSLLLFPHHLNCFFRAFVRADTTALAEI